DLKKLAVRVNNSAENPDALRRELLAYQVSHAGTAGALEAAALLRKLPSPLDQLSPDQVPATERFPGEPAEEVALFGSHRPYHWGAVRAVAYSADGRELASGGHDGFIRIWTTATGRLRTVLPAAGGEITALVFSTDGQRLVSGGMDGTIRIWDPVAAA